MNYRLEYIYNFFENKLPSFYASNEIRLTQVQMAVKIAAMMAPTCQRTRSLIIHAPVGTGKTFGALAPTIYNLKKLGNRLIYCTSSINLQSQLKNEELRYLKQSGEIRDFIIAKGTGHYICPKRLINANIDESIEKDLKEFVLISSTGDRVEFERQFYPLSDDLWSSINLVTSDKKCVICKENSLCPTYSYRKEFNNRKNQVIVTNHNQLIQSVINKTDGFMPIIDYTLSGGAIVIDEAHDFEDAVLGQLSESLELKTLLDICRKFPRDRKAKAIQYIDIIKKEIFRLINEYDTTKGRHSVPMECMNVLKQLNNLLNIQIVEETSRRIDRIYSMNDNDQSALEKASETIGNILNIKDYASWFDLETKAIVTVTTRFKARTKAIISDLNQSNKLVIMSGTLAVNNSFDHLLYSWGGPIPNSEKMILDTVFDYEKQAILYIPVHLPRPISAISPGFREYCLTLSQEIIQLIKITGGRTLILCTSHKQMEILYKLLENDLKTMGITFLKQGQKNIELITEDFKNDETSVLIGTGSFFAGLSVKGKSLISVILCRLPFPPPDDPFLKLIAGDISNEEKMDLVDFPRMMIRLLQAGGRLIRSIDDFGCFTILDPRTVTMPYSDKILSELRKNGYNITHDIGEVEQFIRLRMEESNFAKYPDYDRRFISVPDELNLEDTPQSFEPTNVIILT